jgi:dihydroorotase
VKILIKNGRLIDPATGLDAVTDIFIGSGIFEKIERNIHETAGDVVAIDATGHILAPGLIDVHAHLREPGFEYKETIGTGTLAAVRGGFTSIVCMANTDPVNDNKSITEYIIERARSEGFCRVFPCGAITKGLKGQELAAIGEMHEAGIVAISDDGKSVKSAALLKKAMECAKPFSMPVISHCEDDDLATGFVHEGEASLISGIKATPSIAEEIIVARDIAIARYTGTAIHLTHLSTAGSVDEVKIGKRRFAKVTCDTCPHYFSITDKATVGHNTSTKVNPPLRSEGDVAAIKEGLRSDVIDIIATDHAPHDTASKEVEYSLASFGISGFETAFALSLSLVREGVLTMPQLLRKLTVNPARLLNLPLGEVSPGKAADLIIFNPDTEWIVDREAFISKGKNTPFHGWKLKGRNLLTIVKGEIAYRDPGFNRVS